MKIRLCICFTSVFIVLMLLVSTVPAFAQKKLKYVPEIVESTVKSTVKGAGKSAAKKSTRIPAVINRKLPLEVQRRLAESSGIVVNTTTAKRTSPGGKTDLAKATAVLAPAQVTTNIEIDAAGAFSAAEAEMDSGTNLTGVQVLQAYFPTWRQELGGMFSTEQLNAVEYAMKATDDWIFVRGANGELQARNKDEWNYEARFLAILQDSEVGFTEKQIKQLIGENRGYGFSLQGVLRTASLQGYMLVYHKIPRERIKEKNQLIPTSQYTPEQQEEVRIGLYYTRVVGAHCPPAALPVIGYVKELGQKYRTHAVSKTPAQYLEEMEKFVVTYERLPHTEIFRDNQKINPADFTPDEKAEYQLAHGVNQFLRNAKDKQDPIYIRLSQLKEQYRQKAVASTPAETLADAEAFYDKNGRMPLAYQKPANAEELAERKLAQRINHAISRNTDPEYTWAVERLRALKEGNRTRAVSMTDEELLNKVVDFIERYGRWPRATIRNSNGQILSLEQASPEEQKELQLGRAANRRLQIHDATQSPALQKLAQIKETYRQHSLMKSPAEHLADLQHFIAEYKRYPSSYLQPNMTPAQKAERALAKNVDYNIRAFRDTGDPAVEQMAAIKEQYRRYAVAMTHQELYEKLLENIHQYHRLVYDKVLYKSMWGRLDYATRHGGIKDPWLQKIYELKTAVQNAPEGKFTLTPDGQGGYILEIEEPAAEELDVTAPQPVEEVAPAAPSPHTIRLRINEETKNLVLATRDHAALERREFPGWLRSMHTAENRPQIANQHTFDALHVLNRAINFDYRNGQNRRAVTYLLETVNNYVGLLGDQEVAFYKLIYRGTVDPEILPVADHFHVVAETQGLSWDGELAPQIEKVNRAYAQAVKRGETPSVYLDGDEDMVTALGIVGRVNIQTVKADFENVIANLLPPGYTVRMGVHELGISGSNLDKFQKGRVHIHLENASAQAGDEGLQIDHSISLDVKVGRFAGWWDANARQFYPFSDAQIAQNYRTLFDSFLDQEAKDKLDELSR